MVKGVLLDGLVAATFDVIKAFTVLTFLYIVVLRQRSLKVGNLLLHTAQFYAQNAITRYLNGGGRGLRRRGEVGVGEVD